MLRRPTSVTVISCIQIAIGLLPFVGSAWSLIRGAAAANAAAESFVPVPVQYAMSFASTVIPLASGYFMLKGRNWARWLCVTWSVFGLVFSLVASPYRWALVPGIFYIATIAYFLFRPEANRFFAASGVGYLPIIITPRRVLSTCCYLMSGFALAGSCMPAFFYPEGAAVGKLFLLMIFLLPAALLLSIGRILSEEPNWKREVGIVLVVSGVAGAWFALSLIMMFADPTFQDRAADKNLDFLSDYLTGGLWITGILLIGVLLLHQAPREPNAPPVHVPIP